MKKKYLVFSYSTGSHLPPERFWKINANTSSIMLKNRKYILSQIITIGSEVESILYIMLNICEEKIISVLVYHW